MPFCVVILAAGQGKRMNSDLPKVLQPLAGRPLLQHVLDTVAALGAAAVRVVYGHGGDALPRAFAGQPLEWVLQSEQRGTGHALKLALAEVPEAQTVLVLYGDVPLVRAETLNALLAAAGEKTLALLSVELADPGGYGRVLRDKAGNVYRVVEERDANRKERGVREVNTGLMAAPAAALKRWLAGLGNDNAQGEYYLTDVIALAVKEGFKVTALPAPTVAEVLGVNDRMQLATVEAEYRRLRAEELLAAGVTLLDPARVDLRGRISSGRDVVIDVNVVLEGEIELGDRVRIGAGCVLKDVRVGADSVLHPHSVLEGVEIGARCSVGPFARLRPGSRLGAGAHIGNFVEVKNATVGEGSKANHLSYLGDADIGRDVNVGAGTITCNYDGANKWPTRIGDGAFIGSGTMLVAPVSVGAGATSGAGSTITRPAPAGQLTVERATQQSLPGWRRPVTAQPEERARKIAEAQPAPNKRD